MKTEEIQYATGWRRGTVRYAINQAAVLPRCKMISSASSQSSKSRPSTWPHSSYRAYARLRISATSSPSATWELLFVGPLVAPVGAGSVSLLISRLASCRAESLRDSSFVLSAFILDSPSVRRPPETAAEVNLDVGSREIYPSHNSLPVLFVGTIG